MTSSSAPFSSLLFSFLLFCLFTSSPSNFVSYLLVTSLLPLFSLSQDYADKIFGRGSQTSLLQAKTEAKISNRQANRTEIFSFLGGSGQGSGTGGVAGGSVTSPGSFFSSAPSFFSSTPTTSPTSSARIPMSQYGQTGNSYSSSDKNYVVGSMTTRREIGQDAKDDVSQFDVTFRDVRLIFFLFLLYNTISFQFLLLSFLLSFCFFYHVR